MRPLFEKSQILNIDKCLKKLYNLIYNISNASLKKPIGGIIMATVSLIIDIVIAVVCLIIIIRNAIRGFLKSIMVLARTVLAFLIAYVFNAPVAKLLENWFFEEWARGITYNAMLENHVGNNMYAVNEFFDGIPEWATKIALDFSEVEGWMQQAYFVEGNTAEYWDMVKVSNALGYGLAHIISLVIAFIALFIIAEIIIALIGLLLNKLNEVTILKVINIVLGALVGAIISAVVAWLIASVVKWVIFFGQHYYPDVFTDEIINRTIIVKFFVENDLWIWVRDTLAIKI